MAVEINTTVDLIKKELSRNITVDKLSDVLFDMGFELDRVDSGIDIELTPERLDLLSIQGFCRAVSCFAFDKKVKTKFDVKNNDYVVNVSDKVKKVRPFTVCAVIKNLKLDDDRLDQIIEVQEKLHSLLARGREKGAIGIYPLDKIKMPVSYTADRPEKINFIPLGFNKKINGFELLKDHEKGREFAHLLEGKNMFPFFVDSNNKILSVPPIINSEDVGKVTKNTKDLFIECSGFDELLLNEMLTNIVTMFDYMGCDIYSVKVKYSNKEEVYPKLDPFEMVIKKETISKLLGLNLDDDVIVNLLEKMMYNVKKINKSEIVVLAPCFRRDLWHEIDVADDIARAYGYNNFDLLLPEISTIGETLPISNLKEELSNIMVGLGFLETYTNTLISKKDHVDFMGLKNVDFIPVINGTENQSMMRVSIIPELLNSLVHNKHKSLPQKIFEVGFVIIPDKDKDVLSRDELRLSAMVVDKAVTFTKIKQYLVNLLNSKGLSCKIKPVSNPSFISGRCGSVFVNNVNVGIIGEIHPLVLSNFKLFNPVACFEINLNKLLDIKSK